MRWHAPTMVIAIPVSARWRAFSASRVQPLGVGQPDACEGHVGDVQHRVEHLAAPDGDLAGVDEEHPAVGDHRKPIGAVAVEDVSCRSVEHPAVGVAVGGDAVVDRRTRLAAGRTGRRPAGANCVIVARNGVGSVARPSSSSTIASSTAFSGSVSSVQPAST